MALLLTDCICYGWLIKSPSAKYVTIFSNTLQIPVKSKWRRRFFILFKPSGSLPHQYAFEYYKDDKLRKKLGVINLEDCKKIQSKLDSSHYQHLFSLKTTSQRQPDKERVYYLAADSAEEMSKWVECLCKLCRLKVGEESCPNAPSITEIDNSAAPNPPQRYDSIPKSSLVVDLDDEELANQILNEITEEHDTDCDPQLLPYTNRRESYRDLSDCVTGASAADIDMGSSLPKNYAPEAPRAITQVSQDDVYDVPKPLVHPQPQPRSRCGTPVQCSTEPVLGTSRTTTESIYQNSHQLGIPGSPRGSLNGSIRSLGSNLSRNNSNRESYATDRGAITTSIASLATTNDRLSAISDIYDVPPQRRPHQVISPQSDYENNTTLQSGTALDLSSPVPPRPPKPSSAVHSDDYMNLQRNSGSSRNSDSTNPDFIYDVPKPISHQSPPPCSGIKLHRYNNAGAKIVRTDGDGIEEETANGRIDSPSSYPIRRPPKPHNLVGSESSMDRKSSETQMDCVRVSCGNTTKTYMRDDVFSDEDLISPVHEDIKLPQRINTTGHSSSEDESISNSDEEGDDNAFEPDHNTPSPPLPIYKRHETLDNLTKRPAMNKRDPFSGRRAQSLSKVSNTNSPLALHNMIPAGPASRKDFSNHGSQPIEYVELDQSENTAPYPSPRPAKKTHQFSPGAVREIEYTLLDEVKTQAIKAVKQERDFNLRIDSKSSINSNKPFG